MKEERIFFERKVLQQLYLGYQHAVTKASDAVSSISDAHRVAALGAAQRGDDAALRLSLRYVNSFLRESVKLKHVHSLYDVFYQSRLLATALAARTGLVPEMVTHLAEYAEAARANGLAFVPSFAAFDLAQIAAEARRADNPDAADVIDRVLAVPHERGGTLEPLVVEAKLKLGAMLALVGANDDAARVRAALQEVPREVIERCGRDLLAAPRCFHEVTDRQVDLRWLRPEERAPLEKLVASLLALIHI